MPCFKEWGKNKERKGSHNKELLEEEARVNK